jgi:hypothetical protein
MTRDEREALIEENAARVAELEADIAERQARRLRGEEPQEWQSPPTKQRAGDLGLIFKTRENSLVEQPPAELQIFNEVQTRVISAALAMIRDEVRKEFASEIAALRTDIEVLAKHKASVMPLRSRDAA